MHACINEVYSPIMWLNRPSLVFLAFFITLVGSATICGMGLWMAAPDAQAHQCQDNIEVVRGRLKAATCDPDQALTFMQDLEGGRYIVCKCREPQLRDDIVNELEFPALPHLSLSPLEQSIPQVNIEEEQGTQL